MPPSGCSVASPSDSVPSPADSALLPHNQAPVLPLLSSPFSPVFKSILCYLGKGNLLTHELDCFPESELNVLQWFAIVLGRGSTPFVGLWIPSDQPFPPGSLTIPAPPWSSHHRELSYTGKRADWTQGHLACGPFGLEHSFFLALCRILTILDSHLDATPLEDSISPQPQKLFDL